MQVFKPLARIVILWCDEKI